MIFHWRSRIEEYELSVIYGVICSGTILVITYAWRGLGHTDQEMVVA